MGATFLAYLLLWGSGLGLLASWFSILIGSGMAEVEEKRRNGLRALCYGATGLVFFGAMLSTLQAHWGQW